MKALNLCCLNNFPLNLFNIWSVLNNVFDFLLHISSLVDWM